MEFVYSTESIGKVTEMERKFVPERFLEASLAAPCPRDIMRKVVKNIMAARAVYVGKETPSWAKKFIRVFAFMGGVGELVRGKNGMEIVEIPPPIMVEAFPEQKTLQTHYPTNGPKLPDEGRRYE